MRIFGIVGWRNNGKTGLMERLVEDITARGITVSTIKHAHHRFDIDQPGKDSYRHRVAGAREVLLASAQRWALMHENSTGDEPSLAQLLDQMSPVDLVLIEGYKRDSHPKIEAHRQATEQDLIAPTDPTIIAVASDISHPGLGLPLFGLDDTKKIADFLLKHVDLI